MAEMIFGCPHCGEAVQCDSEYAGQTVACPHCQGGIIVPAEEPAGESVVSEQEPEISDSDSAKAASDEQSSVISEQEPEISDEEPEVGEDEPEQAPEAEEEPVISDSDSAKAASDEQSTEDSDQKAEAEEEPASEESEVATEGEAGTGAPVAPKPKQPRLPSPGAKKKVTKRMVRTGGKIVTKKGPLSSAAAGAAAKQTPKPQPESEKPESASPELAPGELPKQAKGWSWAAFLWGPIWAIGNKVWWGLLTLVPVVNIVMIFILAVKGKKQAWAKAEAAGKTIEHFVKIQKRWVLIWLILFVINILASVGTVLFGGAAVLSALKGGIESGAITIEQGTPDGSDVFPDGTDDSSEDEGTPIEDMDGGMDDVEDLETPVDDTEDPPSLDMDSDDMPALEL